VKTADKRLKTIPLVLLLGLAGVSLPRTGGQTQSAPNPQEQVTRLIRSLQGPDLFRRIALRAMAWMPKERVQQRPP